MGTKLCSIGGEFRPATSEFFYWNSRDLCWQSGCKVCRSLKATVNPQAKARAKQIRDEERKVKREALEAHIRKRGGRVCRYCGEFKVFAELCKGAKNVAGYSRCCHSCSVEKQRKYKPTYVQKYWARILLRHAQSGARTRNLPCTITEEDILALWETQQGRCYWYDVPLEVTAAHKAPRKPSLDRLDARQGYVLGNVVLACYTANIGRNTTTAEDFRAFVELLRRSLNPG